MSRFSYPKLSRSRLLLLLEMYNNSNYKVYYKGSLVCDIPIDVITTEVFVKRDIEPVEINQGSSVEISKDIDFEFLITDY